MLDHSVVKMGSKNIEMTDRMTDRQKRNLDKSSKKTNTFRCQSWSRRYSVPVLSTTCGGCHPERFIVASLHKTKHIMIILIPTIILIVNSL